MDIIMSREAPPEPKTQESFPAFALRLQRSEYFQIYTTWIRLQTKGRPQPQLCIMAAAMPMSLARTDLERGQSVEGAVLLKLFLDHIVELWRIWERKAILFC